MHKVRSYYFLFQFTAIQFTQTVKADIASGTIRDTASIVQLQVKLAREFCVEESNFLKNIFFILLFLN